MEYQLGRRVRLIALIDFFFSSCSIIFFLIAMWIMATDVYRREVLMVIGSIGTLICVAFKSFGLWTCYKLIIVMIQYKQNEETNGVKQLALDISSKWLKAKKVLLIVPILTFGFVVIAFWDCWVCVIVGLCWIALETILIHYGSLNLKELEKLIESSALNESEQLVHQLFPLEVSV